MKLALVIKLTTCNREVSVPVSAGKTIFLHFLRLSPAGKMLNASIWEKSGLKIAGGKGGTSAAGWRILHGGALRCLHAAATVPKAGQHGRIHCLYFQQ